MADQHVDHMEFESDSEAPMVLSHFVHTLRTYRWVILAGAAAVALAYALIALLLYLLIPGREITSLPFRLDFEGATRSRYPNGLKFSTAEITSSPVLQKVYQDNRLEEYMPLQTFSRSVFVLESNRESERLAAEYQGKLTDPKLNSVERSRLEQEYELKRSSLSKSDYSLNFMQPQSTKGMPRSVVHKVLTDTLAGWARQAAVEKRALDYRVPVLTANVLDRSQIDTNEYAVALTILRTKATQILDNINVLSDMPGADLIRTKGRGVSLAEVELDLEDLIRYKIEPMILVVHARGLVRDQGATIALLEAQLGFDQRRLDAARSKEEAIRSALSAYEQKTASITGMPAAGSGTTRPAGSEPSGETVMPQISESFLDRVVALASSAADREYRQALADDIKDAALDIIPAESAVSFDRELLERFRGGTGRGGDGPTAQTVKLGVDESMQRLQRAVTEVHEIYTSASRQLNPVTELYTLSAPPTSRRETGVSLSRLLMLGVLVTLLSIPIFIIAAVLHNRVKEEEVLEERLHPSPAVSAS